MPAYTGPASTTLTVQNNGSVATLSLTRDGHGTITFTDVDGNTVKTHGDPEMTKLYDAIAALT